MQRQRARRLATAENKPTFLVIARFSGCIDRSRSGFSRAAAIVEVDDGFQSRQAAVVHVRGLLPLASSPVLPLILVIVVIESAMSSSCVEMVNHVSCDRFTLGPTHLDRRAIVDSTVDPGQAEELLEIVKVT